MLAQPHNKLGLEGVAQLLTSGLLQLQCWPLATQAAGPERHQGLCQTLHMRPLRLCQLPVPSTRTLLSVLNTFLPSCSEDTT